MCQVEIGYNFKINQYKSKLNLFLRKGEEVNSKPFFNITFAEILLILVKQLETPEPNEH